MANSINIFDPAVLIVSGELFEYSQKFYLLVKELTREKILKYQKDEIVIIKQNFESPNYKLGAVSLIFDAFFHFM